MVCEGCAFARYCDEECLNAAAAVHTHECKALSILAGENHARVCARAPSLCV